MSDWTDFLPTAVSAPIKVYQNQSLITKWWKKLLVHIDKGNTNVIVTGAAGAGKTVLTMCLHGEVKDHEWEEPQSSKSVEKEAISIGDWTKIFTVIPGQDMKEREIALNESFNKHQDLDGVIHVVDFGYTTIRSSVAESQMIESGTDSIAAIRDFNLNKELEEFKRLSDWIVNANANGRGPNWLVIAVNKADLYLDDLDDAKAYYHPDGSGPFKELLDSLMKRVGSNALTVKVVPVCPKPKPFTWGEEKVLPKLVSFEEPTEYMKNFVSMVAEASSE
ncbi:TPA: GTPase domain-containing protein [Vibrio cholerae]